MKIAKFILWTLHYKSNISRVSLHLSNAFGILKEYTLPPEMFGAFGSVWFEMALGEVGMSLP